MAESDNTEVAVANSSSRNKARVLWVTVHTAEGIRKAADLKLFFDRSTTSSAHAVADDVTLLDNLVPYERASWTLRDGNARSDNLELCGFAAWTRAEWLVDHPGMLHNAAIWIQRRCAARGIPLVKLTPADVRAGRAGVIGHADYTQGTGDGTHWDPGPGFPWDYVMAQAVEINARSARHTTTEDDAMFIRKQTATGELWALVSGKMMVGLSPAEEASAREQCEAGRAAVIYVSEATWNEWLKYREVEPTVRDLLAAQAELIKVSNSLLTSLLAKGPVA